MNGNNIHIAGDIVAALIRLALGDKNWHSLQSYHLDQQPCCIGRYEPIGFHTCSSSFESIYSTTLEWHVLHISYSYTSSSMMQNQLHLNCCYALLPSDPIAGCFAIFHTLIYHNMYN